MFGLCRFPSEYSFQAVFGMHSRRQLSALPLLGWPLVVGGQRSKMPRPPPPTPNQSYSSLT